MRPRVLTTIACVPLLAALAVLTVSTARADAGPARPDPVGARLATAAGALAGTVLAVAVLRRAPAPEAVTPR